MSAEHVAYHRPLVSGLARPVKLFVADGTWPQANRIHRRFSEAVSIRNVCLSEGPPSDYRLRKRRARPDALATMEALARAYGVLEGAEVERQLMAVFQALIERTLRAKGLAPG